MSKKAILLVRVSTDRQDFDEQELNLYNMALADGYAEEDIIPISEKESGIKLSEEERSGLRRMKEIIETEDVAVVYAFEVSRIARKKKISFSVTDFLIEHGVDLIIKTPYIRLMNPDGSVNDGMETIFTLYAQMAESEMRIKKERWHRTHVKNSREGKWNGGHPVLYGYKLDANNYYIINEEQAEVIRKAYEIYTTTNCGTTSTMRELQKLGYDVNYDRVAKILTDEHYTGKLLPADYHVKDEKTGAWKRTPGLMLKYPAIISEETFEEAKRRRATNNSNAYKRNSYYFGRGLIRCADCGAVFAPTKTNGWYVCANYAMMNHDHARCKNNTTIGINVLDTILWDCAVSEYINANKMSMAEKIENAKAKIAECEKIISASEERIKKVDTKLKKLAFVFVNNDKMTEDDYNKAKEQIAEERRQIDADRVSAEERINYYNKVINERGGGNMIDHLNSLTEEAFSMNELKQMCEIVHSFIERVELSQGEKRTKFVTIHAVSGAVYKYKTRYTGHAQRYWREADEIIFESMSPWVEFTPNIIIRRKVAHLRKDASMKDFVIIRNDTMGYNIQNEVDKASDKATGVKKMIELGK